MKLEIAKIEAIENLWSTIKEKNGAEPVYDGINNFEMYKKAKLRILWILKEANDQDEEGNGMGGYDMRKSLRSITINTKSSWRRTFNPIVYTSYGILSDFTLWNDMGNTHNNQEIVDVLKEIAFINLKKIPGGSKSVMSEINDIYQKEKHIVLEQIEAFAPHIIIGGNTIGTIANDFNLDLKRFDYKKSFISYAIKGYQIFIDAYHPNNRSVTQENYCDSIIECVKMYLPK